MVAHLDDHPREACGVVAIYLKRSADIEAARQVYFGLSALQHRGQESAGITASDGKIARNHKEMGLVSQVFSEGDLRALSGHMAIGHNRYSTKGGSHIRNAQPYLIETLFGPLAVAHNGNLTNSEALRRAILARGVGLTSATDSEVITQMLAAPPPEGENGEARWPERIGAFMQAAKGAYSLTLLTGNALFALRDPQGFRPLCVGELLGPGGVVLGWVAASETCALGTLGARFIRELDPGEVVKLDAGGISTVHRHNPQQKSALCVFEYIYFARPDSMLEGEIIHRVRQSLGEALGREAPVEADVVIGVPDSAIPAAIGFARASGIPYTEGLTKNRYIGRTFIQPSDQLRRSSVHLKYNTLRVNLEGKRVVMVDDSIVRGNTMGPLVRLLREGGGAREVHVRISSPPIMHPCFMGVDMPSHSELIAHGRDLESIRRHVGADSLAYLSQDGLLKTVEEAVHGQGGHCSACFSGHYPVEIGGEQPSTPQDKLAFERLG